MTTQHTPGPWTFSHSDAYGDIRFYVAQADGAPYTPQYSDVATLIAETVSSEREAIQSANARLIAAAPELLEALKLAAKSIPGNIAMGWLSAAETDTIRAAIAKATGAKA